MKKIKTFLTAISAFCMLAVAKTSLAITSDTLPSTDSGLSVSTEKAVFNTLIKNALLLLGGIATLMIIWGGFLILFGGESDDNQKKGRKMITYAIIGIIVIALAATIVNFAIKIF